MEPRIKNTSNHGSGWRHKNNTVPTSGEAHHQINSQRKLNGNGHNVPNSSSSCVCGGFLKSGTLKPLVSPSKTANLDDHRVLHLKKPQPIVVKVSCTSILVDLFQPKSQSQRARIDVIVADAGHFFRFGPLNPTPNHHTHRPWMQRCAQLVAVIFETSHGLF